MKIVAKTYSLDSGIVNHKQAMLSSSASLLSPMVTTSWIPSHFLNVYVCIFPFAQNVLKRYYESSVKKKEIDCETCFRDQRVLIIFFIKKYFFGSHFGRFQQACSQSIKAAVNPPTAHYR